MAPLQTVDERPQFPLDVGFALQATPRDPCKGKSNGNHDRATGLHVEIKEVQIAWPNQLKQTASESIDAVHS